VTILHENNATALKAGKSRRLKREKELTKFLLQMKVQKTTFKVPEGLLGASMSQSTSSFGRAEK